MGTFNLINERQSKNSGFTFVEILVSIVVISLGVLGVSVLQVNTLKNSQNAHYRNVASEYAISFSERLRSGVGDKIYIYNDGEKKYRLSSGVACFFQKVGSESFSDAATFCETVPDHIASDVAHMNNLVEYGLPQAAWQLSLLRSKLGVVSEVKGISLAACDFSLASAVLASAPCSLQVSVSWKQHREDVSNTISYSFR